MAEGTDKMGKGGTPALAGALYFTPSYRSVEFQCMDRPHFVLYILPVMDLWVVSALGLFRFTVIVNGVLFQFHF